MTLEPNDELDHFAGPSSAWSETWEFRAATPHVDLAVAVAVVRRPAEGQMSYRAAVLGRSRPPIVVVEHEIAAPRVGLELRGNGLWADHVCETPHEHWSFGLEAFALALDDEFDLITSGRGLPMPLGFDLEWEASADPVADDTLLDGCYHGQGTVHGEVLIGDDRLPFDGPGARIHRWGTGPSLPQWWSSEDESGTGTPPWSGFAEAARVVVHDSAELASDLQVGSALIDGDESEPAWRSCYIEAW